MWQCNISFMQTWFPELQFYMPNEWLRHSQNKLIKMKHNMMHYKCMATFEQQQHLRFFKHEQNQRILQKFVHNKHAHTKRTTTGQTYNWAVHGQQLIKAKTCTNWIVNKTDVLRQWVVNRLSIFRQQLWHNGTCQQNMLDMQFPHLIVEMKVSFGKSTCFDRYIWALVVHIIFIQALRAFRRADLQGP